MTLREFVAKAPANKNLCIAFGIGSGWLVIGTKNEISFKAIDQEQHKARNFDIEVAKGQLRVAEDTYLELKARAQKSTGKSIKDILTEMYNEHCLKAFRPRTERGLKYYIGRNLPDRLRNRMQTYKDKINNINYAGDVSVLDREVLECYDQNFFPMNGKGCICVKISGAGTNPYWYYEEQAKHGYKFFKKEARQKYACI